MLFVTKEGQLLNFSTSWVSSELGSRSQVTCSDDLTSTDQFLRLCTVFLVGGRGRLPDTNRVKKYKPKHTKCYHRTQNRIDNIQFRNIAVLVKNPILTQGVFDCTHSEGVLFGGLVASGPLTSVAMEGNVRFSLFFDIAANRPSQICSYLQTFTSHS